MAVQLPGIAQVNPERERLRRLQSQFSALIDLSAPQRAARLDALGAEDQDLRVQLQRMLAFDAAADDPLRGAVDRAADAVIEDQDDRLIGERIGPYKIVSVLGQGGMSTVYTAERVDLQYRQKVAIKVLHHTALHPRLRARLHSERHILASLDHPWIARMVDSGDFADGTPYIVMEHVAGENVDVFCDERTLSIPERLALFVQICGAVQYAHRNLVVHRDLKPGNILVTADGAPKLLDFGIAKLLAPESASHTVAVTRLHERMLTPENAAPEQILGRPITTATDIYALGVLLYQLLTGRSPYRLHGYSHLQLERAICMDDPLRPSQIVVAKLNAETDENRQCVAGRRGLSAERLRHRLMGDLDAIVALAMRKEPDLRYPSAQALADDIDRHLHKQPVLARQGDRRYHTTKFLRRHLLVVAALAAVLIGMAAIIGVTLYKNQRIERERETAARERDRARQVSGFLVDVFSQADPFRSRGHDVTAKELLDRGAEKIMKNLGEQPEVRAQLLESIGLAYRRQGLSDRAIPLFEEALSIRRKLVPVDAQSIAASLANLALALSDAGNLVSADAFLNQALQYSRGPDNAPTRETADVFKQLGQMALEGKSNPDAAIDYFSRALSIYRQTLGNEQIDVATTLNELASAENWKDNFKAAEAYQRQAIAIFETITEPDYPSHAISLANLGYTLIRLGKYDEADHYLTEALQIERRVFGPSHQRVAEDLEYQAQLAGKRGEYQKAIQLILDSLRISRERLGSTHYVTGYREELLARLYLQARDYADAEAACNRALAIYAVSLPPHHLYVASVRQDLGEALMGEREYRRAETELRSALALNRELAGIDSWRTARAEASLGTVLIALHRNDEGVDLLEGAQQRLSVALGPADATTREASRQLADYYYAQHRDADAARVLAVPATR